MIAQISEAGMGEPNKLEAIQTKLQHLIPAQQQQVLEFVEFLLQKSQQNEAQKTIWDKIDDQMEQLPSEVWQDSPTDGSYQHDHYLYGTPKREL
jgi:hypothetical protein